MSAAEPPYVVITGDTHAGASIDAYRAFMIARYERAQAARKARR